MAEGLRIAREYHADKRANPRPRASPAALRAGGGDTTAAPAREGAAAARAPGWTCGCWAAAVGRAGPPLGRSGTSGQQDAEVLPARLSLHLERLRRERSRAAQGPRAFDGRDGHPGRAAVAVKLGVIRP